MIDTLQCKCVGLRAIAPSIVRVKDRARKLTTKETERTQTRKQNTGGEQNKRYSGLFRTMALKLLISTVRVR